MRLSLLLLSIPGFVYAAQPCIDQPYFNYKCAQLVKYCQEPQAMRIRKSCPLSCGMCRSNSTERREPKLSPGPRIYHQFNRAIKRESFLKAHVTARPTTTRPTTTTTTTTTSIQSFFDGLRQLEAKGRSLSVGVPELFVAEEEVTTEGRLLTENQVENELRECCRGNFIASDCLSLCSYSVEPQQIINKALSRTCSERDANIWLKCVSAGNPNNGCCEKQNVIGCENLCLGRFSVVELMTCIEPYLRPILQCHKDSLTEGY